MKPDSEFVEQNSHGRAMFTYIAKYSMEEKTCNIQFQAFSDEDAQQRIEEMKASLQAIGQIYKAFRR